MLIYNFKERMAKQKKQKYEGVVYSTDEEFEYEEEYEEEETLAPQKQNLKIYLDRRLRKGKVVTIVDGFIGREEDLNDLAKEIKQKCGVGGSAKEGQIIIQGELLDKVGEVLSSNDYRFKKVGK